MSSFSSFFTESCLKENMGLFVTLGTDAGIGFGVSGVGWGIVAIVEGLDGSEVDFGGSAGEGSTLLTTLFITFTTFLGVAPFGSSVVSG